MAKCLDDLNKKKFLKLSARQRWDFIKNSKTEYKWCCINCNAMVDNGVKPTRVINAERFCGNCDRTLTRRTGGGMNDPCNYYPVRKRFCTKKRAEEDGMNVVYKGKGKIIGKDGEYIIIKAKVPKNTYIGDPIIVTLGKFENQEQREEWNNRMEIE